MGQAAQGYALTEVLRFWLGFSTACGPFNQFAICKYSTKLWDTSIYAREQAVICSNSLSDLCTNNSVSVSPLESIIAGKRHCGLWMQDFLQDLKVVWLNKTDTVANRHLAYQMIPPEKPDIIYLLNAATAGDVYGYGKFSARIVNIQGVAVDGKAPQSTISQIKDAVFTKLEIQNAMFMTFAMPQYPTWFFPVLFHNFDLVIDQRHVIPQPYDALTQSVCGQMFDCFVDQDVVSAPSDLYHSLTFENINTDDQKYFYGYNGANVANPKQANIFYRTTLFNGTKETKTLYPNKFMLAWKLATDDSFMRGYNSSKISARTNIQVILNGNLVREINETMDINQAQKQNVFAEFSGTRAYPDPVEVGLTPITHYLCDAIVRIMFDDNPDPQVLSMEVIGEMGGSMIRNG
ncbi:MAG: hypothetical protein EZS28_028738 [Streblomastix strix]|uniref:Uncharacterized protein n=1 Tax=Streblomastix strix TaxID=222440 RepID=A0A5J4UZS9_9EUKA|nr:MAG: hypothetical protein EZS28_028738 [Streblomastix strix]